MKNRLALGCGFARSAAAVLASALIAFVFAACGGSESEGPAVYTITSAGGEGYTVSAPDGAEAFNSVEFTVSVTAYDKYIEKVTVNGKECRGSDGVYNFLMPAENAEIAVQLGTYTDVLSDGNLAFITEPRTTIPKDYGGTWTIDVSLDWRYSSYMTILDHEIVSTDPSVIPKDAITVKAKFNNTSGLIQSAVIEIDTTKIKAGSTFLLMKFANGNTVPDHESNLVMKCTVTE